MSLTALFNQVPGILTVAIGLIILAVTTSVVTRRRRPALEHVCWLLVLLRLITPSLIPVTVPGFPAPTVTLAQATSGSPSFPTISSDLNPGSPGGHQKPSEGAARELMLADQFPEQRDPPGAGLDGVSEKRLAPENPGDRAEPERTTAVRKTDRRAETGSETEASRPLPTTQGLDEFPAGSEPSAAASQSAPKPPASEDDASPGSFVRRLGKSGVLAVLATVWLAGSTAVFIRLLKSMNTIRRLVAMAEPVGPLFQRQAEETARQLGLHSVPELRHIAARVPPFVWSSSRGPLVIVPRDLENAVGTESLNLLLAHEFAHVGRRDHWVRWIEMVATVVWWWCPIFRIAQRRLRLAEEAACDAWVTSAWPARTADYLQAIVRTIEFVQSGPTLPPLATGGLSSIQDVEGRLRAISRNESGARLSSIGRMAFIAIALVACPLALTGRATPPPSSAPGRTTAETLGPMNPAASVPATVPTGQGAVDKAVVDETTAVAQARAPSDRKTWQEQQEAAIGILPKTFDVLTAVTSPDQSRIALVGSRPAPTGENRQFGLFCYEIATRQAKLLIEKAIKTTPAWSPDSTRIAIGNAEGYGNIYPLVIVNAVSGAIDETGVQGAGAAWSPDGRYVAVSTQFGNAGSWIGGVPADGRIGLWDTQDRKLTFVSSTGLNLSSRQGGGIISGSVRPVWSPDGQWLAWLQRTNDRSQNDETPPRSEIWASRPNGKELRRIFGESHEVYWSSDSESLTDVKTGTTVRIRDIPADSTAWPKLPEKLQKAVAADFAAAERAAAFSLEPVLHANRLWQNPSLAGIESIEFIHRMSPMRLDEHFLWRKDGTTLTEVTARADDANRYGVGWQELNLPDGSIFTTGNLDGYPRYRSPEQRLSEDDQRRQPRLTPAEHLRRATLLRLSATSFQFPAIDWGRRPEDFVVSDFTEKEGLKLVELRPSRQGSRNFELHAGAMFRTTSWAYMHDVRIDRSVLTIDPNHRIIREEDWRNDQRIAIVDLLDWKTSKAGEQAPGRIRIQFTPEAGRRSREATEPQPEFSFVVDQHFRITPEGLWLLEKGSSKFAGATEPQTEEVVDLKINAGSEELDRRLKTARQRQAEMTQSPDNVRQVPIPGLTPIELGLTHQLQPTTTARQPQSIRFLPSHSTSADEWPNARLTAELRYSSEVDGPPAISDSTVENQLLIAIFDQHRSPIFAARIPEAAIDVNAANVNQMLPQLTEHHGLWLRHRTPPVSEAHYAFHVSGKAQKDGQDRVTDVSLPNDQPAMRRGITLTMALDAIGEQPDRFLAPVAFSAKWKDHPVKVYGITGPGMVQSFGSGVSGEFRGGYTTTLAPSVVIVTDATTGHPLVEQSAGITYWFSDYAEFEPGRWAPLRICCRSASMTMDLRFQIADKKLWLFDHRAGDVQGFPAFVDGLTIEGALPEIVVRSQISDSAPFPEPLDWTTLTERKPLTSGDPLTLSVISTENPFEDSAWQTLQRISVTKNPSGDRILRYQIESWPPMETAAYWSLSRLTRQESFVLSCSETIASGQQPRAKVVPLKADGLVRVPIPEAPLADGTPATTGNSRRGLTRVFRIEANRRAGDSWSLAPEVLSTDYYAEHNHRVTLLLLDASGALIDGASTSSEFRTIDQPELGRLPSVALRQRGTASELFVLSGCYSVITSMPMGSLWGRIKAADPPFSTRQLLTSRFADVRQSGLQQLYRDRWGDAARYFARDGKRDRRRLQELQPYLDLIEGVLKNATSRTNVSDTAARDSDLSVAIACRLAGFSDDSRFHELLRQLLDDESAIIGDSAAIGLGLLGDSGGVTRLKRLSESLVTPSEETRPFARFRTEEIRWAMQRLEPARD